MLLESTRNPDNAAYSETVEAGTTWLHRIEVGDVLRITDLYGNHWSIATHVEDITAEELEARLAAMGEG